MRHLPQGMAGPTGSIEWWGFARLGCLVTDLAGKHLDLARQCRARGLTMSLATGRFSPTSDPTIATDPVAMALPQKPDACRARRCARCSTDPFNGLDRNGVTPPARPRADGAAPWHAGSFGPHEARVGRLTFPGACPMRAIHTAAVFPTRTVMPAEGNSGRLPGVDVPQVGDG